MLFRCVIEKDTVGPLIKTYTYYGPGDTPLKMDSSFPDPLLKTIQIRISYRKIRSTHVNLNKFSTLKISINSLVNCQSGQVTHSIPPDPSQVVG